MTGYRGKESQASSRRRALLMTGLAGGVVSIGQTLGMRLAQAASEFPGSGPIELVVPGGPGAGTDVVARVAAKGIAEHLPHTVVVKNMPGAAGIIGAQSVARARADGHSLLFAITGTHTVNQFLYPDLPYDPKKDFVPVSLVCKYNNVLVVRPDFETRELAPLIKLIKANPGKFFYGITQNGSSSHLAMELLKHVAKLDLPGVPYKGAAAAVSDFLGGQFPIFMDTVINQLPQIKAGKVIPIATTGAQRSPVLPDVPTIAESGYPTIVAIGWGGVMAPAATPAAAVQKLNAALKATIESPAFDALKAAGLETQYTTPEQMAAFIEQESAKWGELVKAGSITPS